MKNSLFYTLIVLGALSANNLYTTMFEEELDLVATDTCAPMDQSPTDAELAQFETELVKMAQEAEEMQEAKKMIPEEEIVIVEEDEVPSNDNKPKMQNFFQDSCDDFEEEI